MSLNDFTNVTVAGAVILTCAAAPIARWIWGHRLGGKKGQLRQSFSANSRSDSDNERDAGLLERWYLNQPKGYKRGYVEAIHLKGAVPTRAQLEEALIRVALQHPTLLLLPDPAGVTTASQVNLSDDVTATANALQAWARHIIEERAPEGPSDSAMWTTIDRLMNYPVDPDITLKQFWEKQTKPAFWRGMHVVLIRPSSGSPKSSSPTKSSSPGEAEWHLVVKMAHAICDGMSGVVFFKHLLNELNHVTRSSPSSSDSIIDFLQSKNYTSSTTSIVRPICSYPSLDAWLDIRPTVRTVARFLRHDIFAKIAPQAAKVKARFYNGSEKHTQSLPVLAAAPQLPEDESEEASLCLTEHQSSLLARSSFVRIHISPSDLASLLKSSKAQQISLNALLHAAATMAAAVDSKENQVRIKSSTPVNLRNHMQKQHQQELKKSKTKTSADDLHANDLIGNYIAVHNYAAVLESAKGDSTSLWNLAREYFQSLQTEMQEDLEQVGLLGFIDPRQYLLKQLRDNKHRFLRSGTFTLTNLGSIDRGEGSTFATEVTKDWPWQVQNFFFVQPVTYIACLFTHNVVSCGKGGLNNLIAYASPLVSEEHAQRYRDIYVWILQRITQGEKDLSYERVLQQFASQ